jgi:type II secretory pathway pseudopilin PulG
MRRDLKSRNRKITKLRNSSRGYILITLMLFMTLLAMAALAVLPDMVQQIQRDREEEMVHRGTEYMRAIKKYYKKFGRYPSRIEELENTNQQRFLRRRYKDPMAKGEKDFKMIRQGDPALNMLGLGGIGRPGQGPGLGQPQMPGNSPFVGQPGGGVRQAGTGDANAPPVTGLPGQQNSGTPNPTGSDSDSPDTQVDPKSASSSSDSGAAPGGEVFGGGPILGVASTSKDKTIREFNKKNHYNEWLFIYDPSADRGGLLKGPVQPDANKGLGGLNQPGVPPAGPGQPGAPPPPAGPPGQQQPPEQ